MLPTIGNPRGPGGCGRLDRPLRRRSSKENVAIAAQTTHASSIMVLYVVIVGIVAALPQKDSLGWMPGEELTEHS